MKLVQFSVLILLLAIPLSAIFTSMHDLEQLAKREKEFVTLLEKWIQRSETRLNQLKRIQTNLVDVQAVLQADGVSKHLENPINAFLLTMRATSEWEVVQKLTSDQNCDTFPKYLDELLEEEDEELTDPDFIRVGASQAILRLQAVYNFSAVDLANNKIFKKPYKKFSKLSSVKPERAAKETESESETESRMRMKSSHCYHIGVEYLKIEKHARAIEWFTLALEEARQDKFVSRVNVLNGLETAFYKSGEISKAKEIQEKIAKLITPSELTLAEKIGYETLIKHNLTDENELFYKLCREGDQLSIAQKSALKCYFLNTRTENPALKLSRVKVEEAHINPDVLIFHDFYSEFEMETLINDSKSNLEYFQQYFYNQEQSIEKSVKTVVRHGKKWKLKGADCKHTVARAVNTRIELYTGLYTPKCYTVFNYGLAGHQDQHYDSRVSNSVNATSIADFSARQLATSNGFISNIEKGGATTFIYLGVTIEPMRGSVIFWYNLDKDGYVDERMRHGACPVLKGNKWTVLQPFFIAENILSNPCPVKIKPRKVLKSDNLGKFKDLETKLKKLKNLVKK